MCVFDRWFVENVPEFTVDGELKEGDIVRRGPDSTSTAEDFLKSKGEDIKMATQYEVGKLTKVTHTCVGKALLSIYHLQIIWGHNSSKPLIEEMSFSWSKYSGFPIELAL